MYSVKISAQNGRTLPVRHSQAFLGNTVTTHSDDKSVTHHPGLHVNPHDSDVSAIRDQVRSNLIKHLEACGENKPRGGITGKPIVRLREGTLAAIIWCKSFHRCNAAIKIEK